MNLEYRKEDRTKWIAGGILALLACVMLYRAFAPAPSPSAPAPSPSAPAAPSPAARVSNPFTAMEPPGPSARGRVSPANRRRVGVAAPPAQIDPRLRLDLLAKMQTITYQGTERNIFQYYTPPPPIEKPAANPVTGPGGAPAKPAGPPPPPPPPPITLKYYGYAEKPMGSSKKAFFSDGDDIFIAGEGDIVNKKYRIVKIGVNTVEAEDIATKHRQVLPLQEQQ